MHRGALFQIGPNVNYANQININITGLDLATLGRNYATTGSKGVSALKTGGSDQLSSSDLSNAALLVTQAIGQIATLRGQLGSLQKNVLESNIVSQQNTLEQVTAAQSTIRDADFAAETANLTRSQILVQAGTSVLSIANSSPRDILALLRQ
jgi:flagellin-like hook-associated protein FlgL